MTGKDYLLAALMGGVYILLFGYLVGRTLTWGDPTAWYEFWGQGNVSAVSWMQILHSIGVVLAALPIAVFIALRYRSDWFRPALVVAIVASSYVLFEQLRGAWLLAEDQVQRSVWSLASGAIDIVKVGLIFVLVVALMRWAISSRRAPS